jgi:hypothetical protein
MKLKIKKSIIGLSQLTTDKNYILCNFDVVDTKDFEEITNRVNLHNELIEVVKSIVHGDEMGMGKKPMKLRIDLARDLLLRVTQKQGETKTY